MSILRKVTPLTAIGLVLLYLIVFLGADRVRRLGAPDLERVRPDAQGLVRIGVGDLEPLNVRFYRFLNPGNQEVHFLVGRDEFGVLQVAFNAGDSHYKLRRGFSHQNGWITDLKCESVTRLSTVNEGGSGCKPVPLAHQVVGDEVILQEDEILRGWRYFR